MDELMKIPPVTRTILAGVFGVTLPIMLKLVSAYTILFSIPDLRKFEVWRLVTPFLYGGEGIPFIFDVFLLFRNSSGLEEGHFFNRTADYAWALILICSTILITNYPLGTMIHFHPLLMAMTHLWAQTNPNNQVSLFGLISMPAPYFPFAMIGLDLVRDGPMQAVRSFTGLASAHLYYFLTTIYPSQNGGNQISFLKTPKYLVDKLGNGQAQPPAPPSSFTPLANLRSWLSSTGVPVGGGGNRLSGGRSSTTTASATTPLANAGRNSTGNSRNGPGGGFGTVGGSTTGRETSSGATHRWGGGNRLGDD